MCWFFLLVMFSDVMMIVFFLLIYFCCFGIWDVVVIVIGGVIGVGIFCNLVIVVECILVGW